MMAWISFFYKIIMSFVYWKASIDYATIIDEKTDIIRKSLSKTIFPLMRKS